MTSADVAVTFADRAVFTVALEDIVHQFGHVTIGRLDPHSADAL